MTASSPPGPMADPFDCTSFSLAELGAMATPALAEAIEWTLALAAHREPGDLVQEQFSFLRRHDG
ncbi:hypothetical protein B0I31_111153 [Saccharothrix carnea]|uniref:Uncharacterized protein n=1 Tax=Saccharothrix carnea TaxID=1280637 RepID=A0A2P8I320_SACCR|nr:hypothetical protein [Saccharothrix carnea]PSL52866.1 hypothetical protein B0I31_111153 [Saccharothrix carnea]